MLQTTAFQIQMARAFGQNEELRELYKKYDQTLIDIKGYLGFEGEKNQEFIIRVRENLNRENLNN